MSNPIYQIAVNKSKLLLTNKKIIEEKISDCKEILKKIEEAKDVYNSNMFLFPLTSELHIKLIELNNDRILFRNELSKEENEKFICEIKFLFEGYNKVVPLRNNFIIIEKFSPDFSKQLIKLNEESHIYDNNYDKYYDVVAKCAAFNYIKKMLNIITIDDYFEINNTIENNPMLFDVSEKLSNPLCDYMTIANNINSFKENNNLTGSKEAEYMSFYKSPFNSVDYYKFNEIAKTISPRDNSSITLFKQQKENLDYYDRYILIYEKDDICCQTHFGCSSYQNELVCEDVVWTSYTNNGDVDNFINDLMNETKINDSNENIVQKRWSTVCKNLSDCILSELPSREYANLIDDLSDHVKELGKEIEMLEETKENVPKGKSFADLMINDCDIDL